MKYSPKKQDPIVRLIYGSCFIVTIALMLFHPTKGAWSSILSSVSLITLFVAMILFIKYDCTAYEYILMERNDTLDFYVNRIVGKRGSYCVYFPLTDCVEIGKYDDSARASVRARYQDARFPKYVQNFISGKDFYYALFKGAEFHECVIFEADDAFITLMKEYAGKAPAEALHSHEDDVQEISIEDTNE